jgi:peptidoglycan/xylan/chitin deacetylase (PgdA/CDA1 family)
VALKLAAVSVDLDEIDNYAAIHGLDAGGAAAVTLSPDALRSVYRRALPRLVRLFRELRVPCTYFAVGRDLVHADNAAALRSLSHAGDEIANHSLSHLYDLTRKPRARQHAEVRGGADAIEQAVGKRPAGFRAPGYTMTTQLADVLTQEGVQYDSSVFPCPAYYAAKTAAIGAIRARGRRSHSIVDDPRVLLASPNPYRMGSSYRARGRGLVELPIGVTSSYTGRLPFIGTSVVLAGPRGARLMALAASGRPLVNLELHGIDLADAEDDGLAGLMSHQPDLRKSLEAKRSALISAIETLRSRGYSFVTLAEAARRLG